MLRIRFHLGLSPSHSKSDSGESSPAEKLIDIHLAIHHEFFFLYSTDESLNFNKL